MKTQNVINTPSDSTRADQIFERFKLFHFNNPIVWELFNKFAQELIANGFNRYSSDAIFHRIRWHMNVEIKTKSKVKLNDHYTAYYARLFTVAHPEHEGFFRNRKRKSEDAIPMDEEDETFLTSNEEASDTKLVAKLKEILSENS